MPSTLEFMVRGVRFTEPDPTSDDRHPVEITGHPELVAQVRAEIDRRTAIMRDAHRDMLVPGDHGHGHCRSCGDIRRTYESGDCYLCWMARVQAQREGWLP